MSGWESIASSCMESVSGARHCYYCYYPSLKGLKQLCHLEMDCTPRGSPLHCSVGISDQEKYPTHKGYHPAPAS